MGLAWYQEIEGEWTPPTIVKAAEATEGSTNAGQPRRLQWLPVVLERQEVQAMLAAPGLALMEKLILRTLYSSAMRVEELVQLSFSALQNNTKSLRLSENRLVMVDGETFEALLELDWSSWQWTVEQVGELVCRAAATCGVAQRYQALGRTLLPKALRYASGSHCLENGMDLYALHQMMGHQYVDTTESIQKLAVGRWRAGYDQCHPLCGQRVQGGSEQSHLSVSEIFQMLDAAKTVGKASDRKRNYLILRLLYASGIRVSELSNLVYGDVFYREGRLFVRQGKGSKDRYVLIDRETGELLREFQGEQALDAPIIDVEVRQIANVIKKVGMKTGILAKYEDQGYSLSPHSFRHAYATHLYRNHMDSFALEKLMGHVDLETTFADYVSCDLAFWQAAYSRHHELAGHRG